MLCFFSCLWSNKPYKTQLSFVNTKLKDLLLKNWGVIFVALDETEVINIGLGYKGFRALQLGVWILGNEKLSTIVDVVFLHHEKLVRKWKNGTEVERCWWLIELNYLSPDTKQIFLTCRFVITRYKCLNSRYDNIVVLTLSYNFEFCTVSLGGALHALGKHFG